MTSVDTETVMAAVRETRSREQGVATMPDVSLNTEGVWVELRANIRGFVGRRVRQAPTSMTSCSASSSRCTVHCRRFAMPTACTPGSIRRPVERSPITTAPRRIRER